MEIAPNSTIILYSNVPIDSSYKNTLWFDNITQQTNFFGATPLKKYTLLTQYYTRVNRGQIKAKLCADDIYDCNYLRFKNTAYGDKWFYAFINSIEWVNNEVSLITFEIDVVQTYLFDATLKQCFVEREHSALDYVGYNTVEEDLYVGDAYVENSTTLPQEFVYPLDGFIILTSEDGQGQTPDVKLSCGMPVGLKIEADGSGTGSYTSRIISEINVIVQHMGGEHIVSAFAVPTSLLNLDENHVPQPMDANISVLAYPDRIDGYVPKNNKMFTSQYCKLYCSNNGGSVVEYKNELFGNISEQGYVTFRLLGSAIPVPEIICVPTNYRHVGTDYDNANIINDFPAIPFVGDTYKAYVATQTESNIINSLSTILQGVIGGVASGFAVGHPVAGGAIGGAISTVKAVGNTIGNYVEANAAPNSAKNMTKMDSVKAAFSRYCFTFYHTTIKREYAEIIDEFFTVFGYATKKIKVPNRHVRQNFTYTKTNGCNIVGGMPSDDIRRLESIYDNGITFWVNSANVGDYSVSNAPITNGV